MAAEDYTTYTEVDPASSITVASATHIDWRSDRNEEAYVYADKGVGHFAGDFDHDVDVSYSYVSAGYVAAGFWAVSNDINDCTGLTDGAYVNLSGQKNNVAGINLNVLGQAAQGVAVAATDLTLYLTVKRVTKTYTLYVYSDSARTSLVGTASATEATLITARYVYALIGYNSGTANRRLTVDMDGLDLQEVALVTKTLTDQVVAAEGSMGLLHLMSLADAVVVLDSNLLRHNISLTDVLQAGDTQTLMHLLSLADVVALADVVSHQHQMGLADQVAAAESRGLQHQMTLTDAVGTAEAQAKQHAMALVEAVALQDSRALKHLMALQDAVSVTTTVTHQQVTPGEMTITDVAVIADGVELMHILSLEDSVWLRQVARIASCGDGSYFERPDGDCRRGYEDDDGQDANLYQELV